MNVGNFLIGLIFGHLLYTKSKILQRFKSKAITIISIFVYLFLPSALKFALQSNNIESTIATALTGAYIKHHSGLLLSIILFNLVFAKGDDDYDCYRRLKMFVFRFSEKLFLSAFFTQIIVTKIFLGSAKNLIEMNAVNVVSKLNLLYNHHYADTRLSYSFLTHVAFLSLVIFWLFSSTFLFKLL